MGSHLTGSLVTLLDFLDSYDSLYDSLMTAYLVQMTEREVGCQAGPASSHSSLYETVKRNLLARLLILLSLFHTEPMVMCLSLLHNHVMSRLSQLDL